MKDNVEIAKEYTDWHIKTGGFARDMTLRDYYAGLAMQAHLSMPEIGIALSQGTIAEETFCKGCFGWADLMLKERTK